MTFCQTEWKYGQPNQKCLRLRIADGMVEISTQNIGVSTTETLTRVRSRNCANDRQLEMATWRVIFALKSAPHAHALRVMSHFCQKN